MFPPEWSNAPSQNKIWRPGWTTMLINHVNLEMREITCITSLGLMSCHQNNSIILPNKILQIWDPAMYTESTIIWGKKNGWIPNPWYWLAIKWDFPWASMSHKNGYKKGRCNSLPFFPCFTWLHVPSIRCSLDSFSRAWFPVFILLLPDLREVHAVMALVGA